MKERLLKYGRIVAYPAAYLVFFVIFASVTFPYDRLKDRAVYAFNADQRATGGQRELSVGGASGYWLSGLKLSDVTLVSYPAEADKPPSRLSMDDVTLRYDILPTLIGNSDLSFHVDGFGGDIGGSFEVHGKDRSLDVSVDDVDLGKVGPITDLVGLPMEGKLEGAIHLRMPEGKTAKETGTMTLTSSATAVGDGKAKIKGTLALPRVDVGTVSFAADAKDGVLKISKCAAGGKDLDFQCDGRITLRDAPGDALCDLQVRFRINDSYRGRNDITKGLFGAPGSGTSGLFELDPKIKQSARADGFYGWSARGLLSRLDFEPSSR